MRIFTAILFTSLFLFSSSTNYAQIEEKPGKESLSYISLYGTTLFGITPVNLSYDYFKVGKKSINGITTGITTTFYGYDDPDIGVHATYTFLSGATKNNHFEFKIGGVINFITNQVKWVPVITLGYRYQPADGKTMFRIGLSTGGIGIGLGYRIN